MQAKFGPSLMSMPIGQTLTHRLQLTQSPTGSPAAARFGGLLRRHALFAAIVAVVHRIGFGIPDRALQPRPGAHEGADLLTREAGEAVGGAGEDRDPGPHRTEASP